METPDVILIKDEDDIGGCEPVVGEKDVCMYATRTVEILVNHEIPDACQ